MYRSSRRSNLNSIEVKSLMVDNSRSLLAIRSIVLSVLSKAIGHYYNGVLSAVDGMTGHGLLLTNGFYAENRDNFQLG